MKCLPGTFFVSIMITKIFAKKGRMTNRYTPEGVRLGATVLEVPMMTVKDLRTKGKNGYEAIRFMIKGLVNKKEKVREVRTEEIMEAGTEIKVAEVFKPGDMVDVAGIMKGKGFAGVVKRYGFKGGPRTHGQSDRERSPGSSGPTTTPGRV
jgi:large subunit ribosomal protein L3